MPNDYFVINLLGIKRKVGFDIFVQYLKWTFHIQGIPIATDYDWIYTINAEDITLTVEPKP